MQALSDALVCLHTAVELQATDPIQSISMPAQLPGLYVNSSHHRIASA